MLQPISTTTTTVTTAATTTAIATAPTDANAVMLISHIADSNVATTIIHAITNDKCMVHRY